MVGRIANNFGLLAEGGGTITATSKRLRGRLDELDRHLKPITDTWTAEMRSESSQQFSIERQRLQAAVERLISVSASLGMKTVDHGVSAEALDKYLRNRIENG